MTRSEALALMARLIDEFDCDPRLEFAAQYYLRVTGTPFKDFRIWTQPRCFTKPPFAEKIDGLAINHTGAMMLFSQDTRGVDDMIAKLRADFNTMYMGAVRGPGRK